MSETKCKTCGKTIELEDGEMRDFCSAKCARAWYGCQLTDLRDSEGAQSAAQQAAARFRASRPFRAA